MEEVENQAEAIAAFHRQHLVFAIGVKRGVANLSGIGRAKTGAHLASGMADEQIAAGVGRGERNDRCREHAGGFFRVAVGFEKAAFVIDEKFVKFGRDRVGRAAEIVGGASEEGIEGFAPCFTAEADFVGADLPDFANGFVVKRLISASIRRAFGGGFDEAAALFGRNGERHDPGVFDLEKRHRRLQRTEAEEIARALHLVKNFGERSEVVGVGDLRSIVGHDRKRPWRWVSCRARMETCAVMMANFLGGAVLREGGLSSPPSGQDVAKRRWRSNVRSPLFVAGRSF